MSGVRKLIAERMSSSAHTTAAVTLTTEVDATELVRLRKEIGADMAGAQIPAPSYNDLLARLLAVALQEFPALNASLHEGAIIQHAAVHIGMAVDTERGLLVPVVRDAHKKSVQAIAAESAALSASARAGKISADDLRGGTFTISNLGMYEIDAFTPIINLPECAILGVGRIVAKQVVGRGVRNGRGAQDDGAEPDVRPPPGGWRPGGTLPAAREALRRAPVSMADALGVPSCQKKPSHKNC